ncbi:MAG: carboxypeptidase-like regulatory domain-containing protein, partial [Planctomycetota bacterium]|nr:carboxypeptidase-like regulatory domain-containing protein [Planctomycetota bacterium]
SISGRVVRRGDGAAVPGLRFSGLRGGVAVMDGADFELKGIRPGRVQVVAEAPGYEPLRLPVDRLEPGQTVELPEFRTQATVKVGVTVSDSAGNRVRKAKVRLLRLGQDRGGRPDVPKKITFPSVGDVDARYERGGVPRTRWLLAVDHPSYAKFREIVSVRSPGCEVAVTLLGKKPR